MIHSACLTCLFVTFLIIGLSTYFSGCHPTLQPNCGAYTAEMTTVDRYRVDTDQCCASSHQECHSCTSENNNGGTCCEQVCDTYLTCYDSFAIAVYGIGNETCTFDAANDVSSAAFALDTAEEEYPLGTEKEMMVKKSSGRCTTATSVEILAIGLYSFLWLSS